MPKNGPVLVYHAILGLKYSIIAPSVLPDPHLHLEMWRYVFSVTPHNRILNTEEVCLPASHDEEKPENPANTKHAKSVG